MIKDKPDRAHLLAKLYNTPHLVEPKKLDAIIEAVKTGNAEPRAEDLYERVDERTKTNDVISNGVAIVNTCGTLVNRGAWIGSYSGLTSYEGITNQLSAAVDSAAHTILWRVDSHGGEAAGCFETAGIVKRLAEEKPIHALVDSNATSAMFALASAATKIHTIGSGRIGSVGVVMRHIDMSKRLKKEGVGVTYIYRGAHKIDGAPTHPLTEQARAVFDSECAEIYDSFVELIATNRNLKPDAVRETEAGVYAGPRAIQLGFADEQCAAFPFLLNQLQNQEKHMKNNKTRGAAMEPTSLAETAETADKTATPAEDESPASTESVSAAEPVKTEQKLTAPHPPEPMAAVDVIAACEQAGVPTAATELIKSGATPADVNAKLAGLSEITERLNAAGVDNAAALAAHTLTGTSADLAAACYAAGRADSDPDIDGTVAAKPAAQTTDADRAAYAENKKRLKKF